MANSNYFDELIVSYLCNELNAEEEAFVLDWINSSEANTKYFEELRSTWNLVHAKHTISKINIDSEWDQFKQVIGAKQFERCNTESSSFPLQVREEVIRDKKSNVAKVVSFAVVACILGAIALIGKRTFDNKPSEKPVALVAKKGTELPKFVIKHQVNTTNKVNLIMLADGTQIKLYGKSEISYSEPFISNKRDVTLVGKARFIVTKDKTRPFTVSSGDISTTALGTQFTVTAFKNSHNISVRLDEGKVVIRSANASVRKMAKYYLLPGQELIYNYKNATAKIRLFKENDLIEKGTKNKSYAADTPSLPSPGKGTWYMFNNQTLTEVFDQLASMFKVNIVYSKKEFSKIYFIGTFNVADSLSGILKQIGDLNNLKILKKNNKVIISR